jgi:tetratricopeptide (TPR) repeat protein
VVKRSPTRSCSNAVYDGIVERYAEHPEPVVRQNAAGAVYNKAIRLSALKRFDEAIALYDEIVDRHRADPGSTLRALVGEALLMKGAGLMELGRTDDARESWRDAVKHGDPTAAQNLVWLAGLSKDVAAAGDAMADYGRLTIAREVQGQWWANPDLDLSALTSEQLRAVSDASRQFQAPYDQKVFAEGERDPYFLARATAGSNLAVRIAEAVLEEDKRRAAYARGRADASREAYETAREGSAQTAPEAWPVSPEPRAAQEIQPIAGCRLVTGPSGEGVANVTLKIRVPESVELQFPTEPAPLRIPWEVIRGFEVDPLPDRKHLTAGRVAALGPLALAAKKSQARCVLTILWDGWYRTIEVPAQAHELRAAFDAVGINT